MAKHIDIWSVILNKYEYLHLNVRLREVNIPKIGDRIRRCSATRDYINMEVDESTKRFREKCRIARCSATRGVR